jgi:hypothetical protein
MTERIEPLPIIQAFLVAGESVMTHPVTSAQMQERAVVETDAPAARISVLSGIGLGSKRFKSFLHSSATSLHFLRHMKLRSLK